MDVCLNVRVVGPVVTQLIRRSRLLVRCGSSPGLLGVRFARAVQGRSAACLPDCMFWLPTRCLTTSVSGVGERQPQIRSKRRATCPYLCIVGTTDIEVAIAAAEAGAEVVARAYGDDHVRHLKSPTDFATVTDTDAERAIRGVLSRYRPGDSQVGEELGASGSADAA